jgi:serine/threonine protein kinase/tetratricopeptide (TPR) repeat protein
MNDEYRQQEAIFGSALLLPASERAAFLAEACGADLELRRRVEGLLNSHNDTAGILERPVIPADRREEVVPAEKPGDKIGPYKLLQRLGEGGCGVVYMAEQEEPLRRRVALKIIKIGMDTRQVIARFEAERQALALMDHPNIAKVLDAGATETGRPYFAMELVRGARITDYCDHNHLPTRSRMELFIQVCSAVQHAHQKGIIHRDLKPSNILVTLHDGVPVPKIIDFGIAKATQGRLTDKTLFTAFEQFIGTPAYMSPEQAEMSGLDIDTRSDIYSLGVLLYELLTGKTPFDTKQLLESGLDAMRRTIREQEPPKPSTKLSTLADGELTLTANRRQTEMPKLVHAVRGDLDWIVMKCLEKDRARRYPTANGLATDLQRHLQHEPVVACPPSKAYRLRKLIRRHQIACLAGAAVFLSLILGLGASAWLLLQERAAKREQIRLRQLSDVNERKAQAQAARSEQVARIWKETLSGVRPSKAMGQDTTMLREILNKTAERLGPGLSGEPEVEAELRGELADVYDALGEYVSAEAMQRAALALCRKHYGNLHTNVAEALRGLGVILDDGGKPTEAESALLESLTLQTNLFGARHLALAGTLGELARALSSQGKLADAEAVARQALAMKQALGGSENSAFASALEKLADVLTERNKWAEAETELRRALMLRREFSNREPLEMSDTLFALGKALQFQRKWEEAGTAMSEALELRRKILGSNHPDVANALSSLGLVLLGEGKLPAAEAAEQEALAIYREVFGNDHPYVAAAVNNLAMVLDAGGKFGEAEAMYREALRLVNKFEGPEHQHAAIALHNLASILKEEGKLGEAEQTETDAVTLARKVFGEQDPYTARFLNQLAVVLREEHKATAAEAICRQALAIRQKVFGSDHLDVADSLHTLAGILECNGDVTAAEGAERACLTIREHQMPNAWLTSFARGRLGYYLLLQQKYREAEPLLLAAAAGFEERQAALPQDGKARRIEGLQHLARLYDETDRPEQAASWKQKVAQLDHPEIERAVSQNK